MAAAPLEVPASAGPDAIGPLAPALVVRLTRQVVTTGARDGLEVETPLTGTRLGAVPSCTAEDVAAAADRARVAQPAWAARGVAERAAVLRRLAALVLERQDEVLDLMQLESGKTRTHAFEEVADVALVAGYYARTAADHLGVRRREGALPLLTSTLEVRHPKGVVGIIAPWNYPLSMAITDALPALVAGNTVVLKPAQRTPFTALWIAELAREAGLPDGALAVVTGRGSQLGDPLIDAVDFVTFTGSTATGRGVAARAGQRLIGAALELGGKNAMLVLDDADLDAVVDGAIRGCFASAGQLCISIERLFVHVAVADEFTRRFVARVEDLALSASLGWDGDVGSLVAAEQLATVTRHVDDAVTRGATVLVGGEPRPEVGPYVYAPTVLTDVTEAMELFTEETFGPVVALATFDDVEDAIARANDSRYGLNASVYTGERRRGERVGVRLAAGTVNINDAYAAAWASVDAPMGGVKDSGLGRRHGREGIHKYTEVQTVATQRGPAVGEVPGLSGRRAAKALTAGVGMLAKLPRRRSRR